MDNNEFLDSISGKGDKKKHKRAADELIEISDESDEEEENQEKLRQQVCVLRRLARR